ncbi:toprim domain-containing protein [Tistrella mobilis]|nr:toprim domain-containing protein [Tistrella mobilis]
MLSPAADLAHRLAHHAEAVCRHYLSNGRKEGRYWLVGDVFNTPGRSLFVRLTGPTSGKGAAGKWTDAATGEHGDLLDLIALSQDLDSLKDTLDEARRFLSLPRPVREAQRVGPAPQGSPEAARRLWAISQSIAGTLAEAYLRSRGIMDLRNVGALRFHPRCYYRADDEGPTETWPALIASVRDLDGTLTGVHRTWLDPTTRDKAPVATQRKAMGDLLGHAVRFGTALDIMAAGEGIETMLSLRQVMPELPMAAALSANHLAALLLPSTLRRLYIARDDDPAGHRATARLTERAEAAGIEALTLTPALGDFNEDLRTLGAGALAAALRVQLAPADVDRFLAAFIAAGDREKAVGPASPVTGGSVAAGSERRERAPPTAF